MRKKVRKNASVGSAVSIISVAAWINVTAMSFLNPSETLEMAPIGVGASMGVWAVIPLLIGIVMYCAHSIRSLRAFIVMSALAFSLTLAAVLWAAIQYHRDYYTLLFQYVLIYFVLVLVTLPQFDRIRNGHKVFRALEVSARGVFFSFGLWVILMGYAIVTRAEPRWIESIMYNLMACIILVFLAIAIAILHQRSFRILSYDNGVFRFDGRNLSEVFTDRQIRVLRAFITAPNRVCTCSYLYRQLGESEPADDPDAMDAGCRTCIETGWTAINCRFYRNIKNQLIPVKKYLELLEVGTVINVANSFRDNKTAGWKLRLFDDVRFQPAVFRTGGGHIGVTGSNGLRGGCLPHR